MPSPHPTALNLVGHLEFATRLASSLIADVHEREEIVQDAMLAALERPPRAAEKTLPFLSTIVRRMPGRRSRNAARRRQREERVANEEALPSAAEVAAVEDMRRHVANAVVSLPEMYRDVLLSHFFDDRSVDEIAVRMSMPVETVRTRIRRGLQRVREKIERADEQSWLPALVALAQPGADPNSRRRCPFRRRRFILTAAASALLLGALVHAHRRNSARELATMRLAYTQPSSQPVIDMNPIRYPMPATTPFAAVLMASAIALNATLQSTPQETGSHDERVATLSTALGLKLASLRALEMPQLEERKLVGRATAMKPRELVDVRMFEAAIGEPEERTVSIAIVPIDAEQSAVIALEADGRYAGAAVIDSQDATVGAWTHFLGAFEFASVPRLDGAQPSTILAERAEEAARGKGKEPELTIALLGVLEQMHAQASVFNLPREGRTLSMQEELELFQTSYEAFAKLTPALAPVIGKATVRVEEIARESSAASAAIAQAIDNRDQATAREHKSVLMNNCSACHLLQSDQFEGTLEDTINAKRVELGIGDGFYVIGHDLRVRSHDVEAAQPVADAMRIGALLLDARFEW